MLICYLDTNNIYRSAKLHEILSGPIFRLGNRLQHQIAAGSPIYNFYRDDAHPNTYGGAAIVDDALERLSSNFRIRNIETRINNGLSWSSYNGGSVNSITASSYRNPGEIATFRRAVSLYTSAAGQGAISTVIGLAGGDYIASLPINPGLRTGGFSSLLEISISERTLNGDSFVISTAQIFGYDTITLLEIPFSIGAGSTVQIYAISPQVQQESYLGPLSIYKLGDQLAQINRGKHVLFGDSWFSDGSAMATRFAERLDKANVIVKGVSGNRASQMIDRFYSDVASQSPDYVWVMVGTNDYYAGTSPALFEQQIHQIRRLIQSIGAQPIIFNASVGAITYSPQKLNPSREYALRVRSENPSFPANSANSTVRNSTFFTPSVSIPAGSTVVVGVSPGMTVSDAIVRAIFISSATIRATVGYSTSADGSGATDITTVLAAGQSSAENVPIPRSTDRNPKFSVIRLHNDTGGAITTSLTADLCWNQQM